MTSNINIAIAYLLKARWKVLHAELIKAEDPGKEELLQTEIEEVKDLLSNLSK